MTSRHPTEVIELYRGGFQALIGTTISNAAIKLVQEMPNREDWPELERQFKDNGMEVLVAVRPLPPLSFTPGEKK